MKKRIAFESFESFAEYSLVKENIPNKIGNTMDCLVGKSFGDLLMGAATEKIEPGTLQSTCDAIRRLLVHEMSPVHGGFTVKRDFESKKRNIFCVTKCKTSFPDEIRKIENSMIELFKRKYNLKLQFGSLTKK